MYQDRWQIECCFTMLKQHLKSKTFVGTSENALKIRIGTALLAIWLIKYLQFTSTCPFPLCRLITLLHWNLFTYRNLQEWLADPFATPPRATAIPDGAGILDSSRDGGIEMELTDKEMRYTHE